MHHFKVLVLVAAALWLGSAFCSPAHAERERERARDIAAVTGAKTSLAQAIATVAQQGGGQPVQASVHEEKGAPLYVITTLAKGETTKTLVDPATGKIVDTAKKGLLHRIFDDDAGQDAAGIGTAKLSLGAAVSLAEQQTGGQAIEAGFKNEHGKMRFEIEMAKNGAAKEIVIDGVSGQVVKSARATDDEHEDD